MALAFQHFGDEDVMIAAGKNIAHGHAHAAQGVFEEGQAAGVVAMQQGL